MLDDVTAGTPVPAPHCTWCSAELPSDHETVCPSCGATLLGDGETQVPGLTAIDAEAILRNARAAKAKPRSRIMSWISGDYTDDSADAAPPGSLAPPPLEVRREMLLLELEAQVANAQAEVESMAADAAIEGADADVSARTGPEPAEGAATDGAAVDGAATDGAATDGAAADGAAAAGSKPDTGATAPDPNAAAGPPA